MKPIIPVAFAAMALVGCNPGGTKSAEPTYVPAHNIRELMMVVMEPQAQVFWNSTGIVMDATGEHDLTPTTDEAWLRSQSAAATVAEMGNLMQTPLYTEGRGADWREFSASLTQVGQLAEKAVIARDTEAMMEISMTMYNVCSACHRVYLPEAAADSTAPR